MPGGRRALPSSAAGSSGLELMPSFEYVLVRWFSTVRWVKKRDCVICRFVCPPAANCATRSSLRVGAFAYTSAAPEDLAGRFR